MENFPTVTRDLHPEPLQLKAHSSIDLSDKDPEMFAAMESVLTPYLQEIIGSNLIAYDLKIEYSPGEDVQVEDIVVTNLVMTCVVTVRSDSLETLKALTHGQADKWFFDFFDGLSVYKFLGSLRDSGIDINEIVFQEQDFRSPLLNGGQVISEVNRVPTGANTPQNISEGSRTGGKIAGVFASMILIGGALLVNYKEKIPWGRVKDLNLSLGSDSGSKAGDRQEKKKPWDRLLDLTQGKQPEKEKKPIGRRKTRTEAFKSKSTLVRKAAIQKKPASSKDLVVNSKPSGKSKPLVSPFNPFVEPPPSDRSHSVAGDFDVPEEYDFSERSPTISSYSGGNVRNAGTRGKNGMDDEEFSMPDDYNTICNTVPDEYSLHCHSILGLVDRPDDDTSGDDTSTMDRSLLSYKKPVAGVVPPSPAYSNGTDEWSVDGYSVGYSTAAKKATQSSLLDMPTFK
jgi:hypothetical protein